MAICATKDDMRSLVHRLDALVALIATRAFRVSRRLGLIDPVLARPGRGRGDGKVRRERSGRTVAGLFLGEGRGSDEEKRKKKTRNAQPPTPNVEARVSAHYLAFFSVVL